MKTDLKINLFRNLMKEKNLDAYVFPISHPHMSEYVAEHYKVLSYLSGFTGSAGTFIITTKNSAIWVDGRYYVQGEEQIKGSEIELFKLGLPETISYTDWLKEQLSDGECVGIDGELFSKQTVIELKENLQDKGIKVECANNLIEEIWDDRPSIPKGKVFLHDINFTGKSALEKIDIVREEMRKKSASHYLVSSLESIAWLLNIRGGDIKFNPVTIAYLLIGYSEATLFIDENKLDDSVFKSLAKNKVNTMPYQEIFKVLKDMGEDTTVIYDPRKTNYSLFSSIVKAKKVESDDIAEALKAVKNETEISNIRNAQIRDGVAMVKLLHWIDKNKDCNLDELVIGHKIRELRAEGENNIGESFDSIVAYKDHAAMMHYKATKENFYETKPEGMLLIDSGGQYLDGTTDITRTIILGDITKEEKFSYTMVLKAHIALARAKFLYGCTGTNIDILARQPLWEIGIDYKCGTGHGIGYFLGVHEGPHRVSMAQSKVRLEEGMLISNEPGIYRAGKFGIRIENIVLVTEDQRTEDGLFLKFDTISYCPIDIRGIDIELLTDREKEWLNSYHESVYTLLQDYLDVEVRTWLENATRAI